MTVTQERIEITKYNDTASAVSLLTVQVCAIVLELLAFTTCFVFVESQATVTIAQCSPGFT